MRIRYLIVAFAAILMVPAFAIAEPPPGKGNDKESQPQVLVVRDANGALVGQMLSVEPQLESWTYRFNLNLWVAFNGDPAQAAYFETHPVVVLTANVVNGLILRGEYPQTRLFFTGADCTGTPYLFSHPIYGVPRVFNLPRLPAEETTLGQVIYVPVDPAETPTAARNQEHLDNIDRSLGLLAKHDKGDEENAA